MKTFPPLIWLLLLTTVLVDLAAYSFALHEPSSRWAYVPLLALQRSQVSLMALWLVLGRGSAAWRLAGVMVGVALWSGLLAALPKMPKLTELAVVPLAQAAIVGLPHLPTRLRRIMRKHTDVEQSGPAESEPGRWQFSIAQMLGWMTALAIVLAALQSFQLLTLNTIEPWEVLAEGNIVLFLFRRAAIAWLVGWAILRQPFPIATPGVLVVVLAAILLLQPLLSPGSAALFALLVFEVLLLAGSLTVVRVAGFRT